jgi:hypothetical protein
MIASKNQNTYSNQKSAVTAGGAVGTANGLSPSTFDQ